MKNIKSQLRIIIILLVIIIINVVAVVWFNNMVFNELENSAKNTLKEMANEQNRAISLIVQNKQDNVKGIVDVITHIGEDFDEMQKSMDIWAKEYEIDTIIITDTEGRGLTSAGGSANISEEPYFQSALDGKIGVTSTYESQFTKNQVLAVTAPIYWEGSVQGTIVAEYDVEKLASLLIGVTDSRGSAMVVNSQGEILLHTYEFPISFENFKTATFEEGKTYQNILDDFATGTPGDVTFSIQGEKKLGEYIPIGIENWMLFFEISESALSDSGNTITTGMLFISVSLILIFIALISYILWARRKSVEQIEKVAYYDELTGVSNLVKFKIDLKEIINKKDFDVSKYVLLKGDIENFKVINEAFGMEVGDKVICQIANIAKNMKGETFEMARTGSDEFIVFAEIDKVNEFFKKREEYSESLKDAVPEVKKHIFNYRYGRYFIEAEETSVDNMINKVAIAHSYARAKSGWAIWDYDEKFKNHMLYVAQLTNKMEESLKNKEFKMFLQPKYGLGGNEIMGAEALVRWIEDNGNVIYPNDFIPLFEKNDFITILDEYMFEKACEFISKRMKANKKCVPISVNFSRNHLKSPNFVNGLVQIANKHNVPTEYLEVELTETTIIENQETLNQVLDELHNAGFSVSIDDFGSGYSSLGMLKEYKFDIVKLDRNFFVTEEGEDRETAKTVLTGVINLVSSLGSKVVAEGIEFEDQVEFLRKADCDFAQGYYFARPMSSEEFEKLLDSSLKEKTT